MKDEKTPHLIPYIGRIEAWAEMLRKALEKRAGIADEFAFVDALLPRLEAQGIAPDERLQECKQGEVHYQSPEDQLRHWYRGADLPRDPRIHKAILALVNLPDPAVKLPKKKQTSGYELGVRIAKQLETLWQEATSASHEMPLLYEILPERPNVPETRVYGCGAQRRNIGHGSGNAIANYSDKNTGPRYYDPYSPGHMDYQQLADSNQMHVLADIKTHSENFHEYVRVSRILQGVSLNSLRGAQGYKGSGNVEIEGGFPTRDNLAQMIDTYFEKDPVGAEKLERLYVKGKLNNAVAHRESNNIIGYVDCLHEMPEGYWEAVLDKANDAQSYDARSTAQQPVWHENILDLRTRGGYLRAIHFLLDDERFDELLADAQLTEMSLGAKSFNANALDAPETFAKALAGLETFCEKHPDFAAHYSRARFEALPTERSFALEVEQRRAATGGVGGLAI